jgi:NADH-quinone oxidoreductase subunit N
MTPDSWLYLTTAVGPELLLAIGGLVVLIFDMVVNDDRHPALPLLTGAALVGALVWSVVQLPFFGMMTPSPEPIFGMFTIDNLTHFARIFALVTGLFVLVLTVDYIKTRTRQTGEFYAFLLFVTLTVILTSASNNLIMIYLAFEFLSITSYIMVGWLRYDKRSNEAAIKYMLYGAISSAVMLYGMSFLYGATGSVDVNTIAAAFTGVQAEVSGLTGIGVAAAILMIVGFGFKAALVPFHQWSPDAYEGAPTPVTTFLAVGPKAAGFAIMIRVLGVGLEAQTADWQAVLNVVALLTMVIANITALVQTDMKRLLAYSSIAQAGYILIGLAVNNPANNEGWQAVLLYLMAYLFTNVGLFVAVVAHEEATGSTAIASYKGLIHRSPFLAASMVIFFLSLLGIPPTAGFLGKFFVFGAAIKEGAYFIATVGVLTSVISAFYYLNVVRVMFFSNAEEATAKPIRFTPGVMTALVISLVGTFLILFYPQPFLQLIPAQELVFLP